MLDFRGLNTDELDIFDLCLDLWLDKLGGLCDFDDKFWSDSGKK